jgi:glycosyltransferase involved in cell wall biosynthesis
MSELVSVLIPAYNAEKWLRITVCSVLAQTYRNVEVIIVDDGSTDDTLAAARAFEGRFVKVVTQPNMGAAAARMRALQLAQGAYVQWLDADDLLHPTKIAAQMSVVVEADDRHLLLSCPFGKFYYRPQKASFRPSSLWRDMTPREYLITRFNENVYLPIHAWLVSRELTEAAGPWTESLCLDDDGEYFCRVAAKSTGIRFVRNATVYYRVGNRQSLSSARSAKAAASLLCSKRKCIRYLLGIEDSPRSRAACLQLLQDGMPDFWSHKAVVAEAQTLAFELGGALKRPTLKWKYRVIQRLLGNDAALHAGVLFPAVRSRLASATDRFLQKLSESRIDTDRPAGTIGRMP